MASVHDSVASIINVDQQFDFASTVMGSNSSDLDFVESLFVLIKRVLSLNNLFYPEIVKVLFEGLVVFYNLFQSRELCLFVL